MNYNGSSINEFYDNIFNFFLFAFNDNLFIPDTDISIIKVVMYNIAFLFIYNFKELTSITYTINSNFLINSCSNYERKNHIHYTEIKKIILYCYLVNEVN